LSEGVLDDREDGARGVRADVEEVGAVLGGDVDEVVDDFGRVSGWIREKGRKGRMRNSVTEGN
jgi:hypothetical protein